MQNQRELNMEFPIEVLQGLASGKTTEKGGKGKSSKKKKGKKPEVTINDVTHEVLNRGAITENQMTPVTERTMAYIEDKPELSEEELEAKRERNRRRKRNLPIEKKRENNKRKQVNYVAKDPWKFTRTMAALKEKFPLIFGDKPVPLKIGVYRELKDNTDLKARDLHFTMNRHCNSTEYLKTIREGAKRFDSQGKPDGVVTREEFQIATDILNKRFNRPAENWGE